LSADIKLLVPVVAKAAQAAINEMVLKKIPFVVTSTLRTDAEQIALFAQGRQSLEAVNALRTKAGMFAIGKSDNSYTVTNCDGINTKSRHQGGQALDVVPADSRGNPYWPPAGDAAYIPIKEVMKKFGFNWGGDWVSFPDAPHYEWPKVVK
jgi:peptidoglycan LD-endopeptidase CwlK